MGLRISDPEIWLRDDPLSTPDVYPIDTLVVSELSGGDKLSRWRMEIGEVER